MGRTTKMWCIGLASGIHCMWLAKSTHKARNVSYTTKLSSLCGVVDAGMTPLSSVKILTTKAPLIYYSSYTSPKASVLKDWPPSLLLQRTRRILIWTRLDVVTNIFNSSTGQAEAIFLSSSLAWSSSHTICEVRSFPPCLSTKIHHPKPSWQPTLHSIEIESSVRHTGGQGQGERQGAWGQMSRSWGNIVSMAYRNHGNKKM